MRGGLTVCLALLVLPAAAGAQERPAEPGRIAVIGRATRELPPDHATIDVGVVTKAPAAGAALDANSAAAKRIGDEARAFGIEGKDVRTSAVTLLQSFRNVRDPNGGMRQEPDGYEATNRVRIRIRDIGRLGEFVRRVVDGGANRIDGITFGIADPQAALAEAEALAVVDAIGRARRMAQAAGVALGPVETIGPPGRSDSGPMRFAAAPMARGIAASGAAVPVEAGSLEVSAEIEVVWSLKQP